MVTGVQTCALPIYIAKEIKALDLAAKQEADESVPDDEEFDPASV